MPSLQQYRDRLNGYSPGLAEKVESLFNTEPSYAVRLMTDLGFDRNCIDEYDLLSEEWEKNQKDKEGYTQEQALAKKGNHRVLDCVWPDPIQVELDRCKYFVDNFKPATPYEKLVHKFVGDYLNLELKPRELTPQEKEQVDFQNWFRELFGEN